MSRIASKKSVKIDLGNGEWVEARAKLSYIEFQPILGQISQEDAMSNAKMAVPLLQLALTAWNLTDDEGVAVTFSTEAILSLDVETVVELGQKLMEIYTPQKKNSEPSAT